MILYKKFIKAAMRKLNKKVYYENNNCIKNKSIKGNRD